jgi:hypothetical protein
MVKGARKKPATTLPTDWKPTEKHWERRHDGIDVKRVAEKFRLHAEANDRRQVNWNAAFSQWLLNARPSLAAVPNVVDDPALLPPVEDSWMRRRPQ